MFKLNKKLFKSVQIEYFWHYWHYWTCFLEERKKRKGDKYFWHYWELNFNSVQIEEETVQKCSNWILLTLLTLLNMIFWKKGREGKVISTFDTIENWTSIVFKLNKKRFKSVQIEYFWHYWHYWTWFFGREEDRER